MAGATAAALWLTANLGEAWWALLICLAIDALLNWKDERRFLTKIGYAAGTTAAAVYLQGATGIVMVHLVVAALAAFELTRVAQQLLSTVQLAQIGGKITSAEAAAASNLIASLQKRVQDLELANAPPTPGSVREQVKGGQAA